MEHPITDHRIRERAERDAVISQVRRNTGQPETKPAEVQTPAVETPAEEKTT